MRGCRVSDQKYRQRGYQDTSRDQQPKTSRPKPTREPGAPAGARRISQERPRALNMPAFREVVRCAECGKVINSEIGLASQCTHCGTDLHTCAQCASFDPGSRFECMQPIKTHVSPKHKRNTCELFSSRTTVERETTTPRTNDSRKAFDDLFK